MSIYSNLLGLFHWKILLSQMGGSIFSFETEWMLGVTPGHASQVELG
jgi:hypothetical protein